MTYTHVRTGGPTAIESQHQLTPDPNNSLLTVSLFTRQQHMSTSGHISINFPAILTVDAPPASETGFSVEAQGTGSFTGLSYTVPAHTSGTLKAAIQVMAITSADVDKLNTMVMSMLSASERSKVTSHEAVSASANLSVWSIFGGGASASYTKTTDTMHSMGLTDDQITTIINQMFEIASKMTHVEIDFTIDNTANDYAVSGDLQLYTISGKIVTSKGTTEYRFLADSGSAGQGSAPAKGNIIPLS